MKHLPSRRNNFIWLLVTLVSLLFCSALFAQLELRAAQILVNVSLMLSVIITVWSMHEARSKWFSPMPAASRGREVSPSS